SGACYFAAIAALTQSKITIQNLNPHTTQGDVEFISILEKMGNLVHKKRDSITIEGKGVKALTVDMSDCPDQVQTLAVLAAFAKGKTVIHGIDTLRVKETDRVAAVQNELSKMGIKTTATKHVLTIFGEDPHGATITTYGDHRMAMSFAVAGTK